MIIGSISENLNLEQRVAITPDIVKRYKSLGLQVYLSKDYATHLGIEDSIFNNLGANLISDAREIIDNTAPVSVALSRQMIWRMAGANHPMDAHKIDSRGIFARGRMNDAKEGVQSFLDKRPAEFSDSVKNDMPEYYPWWAEEQYS